LVNEAYEALKHVATTEDEDGNCSHFSVIFQLEFEKYGSQIPIKILPPPALSEKQSSIDEMKEMNPCATATTDDN
jgi:hypothetical protein